jgi:hypothetical protein
MADPCAIKTDVPWLDLAVSVAGLEQPLAKKKVMAITDGKNRRFIGPLSMRE